MNKITIFLLRVSILLITSVGLLACGDYSISLPSGYSLVRIYSGAIVIAHTGKGIIINANIDGYKALDEIIVGHVTSAELTPEKNYSKPGYFIINTKKHETKERLDKKAWLEALQKMNIMSEPKLSKPSRFDKKY